MAAKFHGQLHCKLDASHRLYLPAKYRMALSDEIIITIGSRSSIVLIGESDFQKFIDEHFDKLGGYDSTNEEHESITTALYSSAMHTHVDTKGRITLPASLVAQAGIVGREVIIVGQRDRLLIANVDYRDKLPVPNVYE